MREGWIKLFRNLLDKVIWLQSTPEQKTILITLLLMANHDDKQWEWKGKKFKANPGQFVTSLDTICKKCGKGISIKNVRSAIEKFEKLDFLINESTKTGRLITIINWGIYQQESLDSGKDNGKEVANKGQSTGKEVATNKNDKNVRMKECKNNIYTSDSNEYRLALYLFNFIKRNNLKAKEPNYQTWSKQFGYILRIDNREIEEVKQVIKWCQTNNFWFKNILSPNKLREKYDTLYLQMGGGNKNGAKYNNQSHRKDEIMPEGETEGAKLTKRAIEKYGGTLDDFECDF